MNEIVASLARWALGSYLVWNAANHYKNLDALTNYVAYKGMSYARELVIVAGVLLGVAGLAVLTLLVPGWVGAIAATLFFIPVSIKMHDFWNVHVAVDATVTQREEIGRARQMEQIQFTKNMAILAGLLVILLT